jgi:hypothetical protein
MELAIGYFSLNSGNAEWKRPFSAGDNWQESRHDTQLDRLIVEFRERELSNELADDHLHFQYAFRRAPINETNLKVKVRTLTQNATCNSRTSSGARDHIEFEPYPSIGADG